MKAFWKGFLSIFEGMATILSFGEYVGSRRQKTYEEIVYESDLPWSHEFAPTWKAEVPIEPLDNVLYHSSVGRRHSRRKMHYIYRSKES